MNQYQLRRIRNLAFAGIAGLAGIIILTIVLAALFFGLWLDANVLGRRGLFTVCLTVLSMPVSLFVVFRLVLRLVRAIEPPPPPPKEKQQPQRDYDDDLYSKED